MKGSAAAGTSTNKKKRTVIYAGMLALVVLVAISQVVHLFSPVAAEAGAPEAVQFEIPMGSTVQEIGEILKEKVIRSTLAFRIATRLKGTKKG